MSYFTQSTRSPPPGRPPTTSRPPPAKYSSVSLYEANDSSNNPNDSYNSNNGSKNINNRNDNNGISPANPPAHNAHPERIPSNHPNDNYRLSRRPVPIESQETTDTFLISSNPTDSRRTRPKSKVLRTWLATSADLRPSKESDLDTPAGYHSPVAAWGIYMETPIAIISLFIIGIGAGISHHFYYSSLNGTLAHGPADQEWANCIGIGLAFLSKTSLIAGVEIARKQWLWLTLRKRFMSISAIDAMFGVTNDPILFRSRDMVLRAKIVTVMAAVIWILPLAAIFTPGTIAVVANDQETTSYCTVPSLRFLLDSVRDGDNQLQPTGNRLSDYLENGTWYKPNDRAKKILTIAGFSGKITTSAGDDTTEKCEGTCSFEIVFEGPAVKCTEKTPWDMTDAPWDNPNQFMNGAQSQGTLFRAERRPSEPNTLWIGVSLPSGDGDPNGGHTAKGTRGPHVYFCENSIARYTIKLEIVEHVYRAPVIRSVEILRPVGLMPTNENSMAKPGYEAYWSTFGVLVGLLEGDIRKISESSSRPTKITNGTQVGLTPLVNDSIAAPELGHSSYAVPNFVPNFAQAIEKMAQTMTVSLLSDRTLVYSSRIDTICTSIFSGNIYMYNSQRLISIYAIAAATAFLMSIMGFIALGKNGVASDGYFSTILLTTRNTMLDDLTAGSCLGGIPLPKELERLKLKYGELCGSENTDGVAHAAMGVEGQVSKLRKRGKYS